METVSNFIQGAIASSNSQRYAAVYNPATGEQIRQVVMSDKAEVEQAIASAAAAFPAWSKHSPLRRARVLFRFKALLEERMDTLARLI
ncbi:aldehyde dehydrogenase family protein, partial [Pantoea agglomerans]|uniref:aldehyde dehydrogenase family protein n=2 Tax=Enterobacterales TaxID=91347 RepID=UPI00201C7282